MAALILDRASGTFRSACLISLIVRIVRIHYVWLTMMRLVAVLVRLTEVALEHLGVSETGARSPSWLSDATSSEAETA